MRIKEVKEEEREITATEACVYYVCDHSCWLSNDAQFIANIDKYVSYSVRGNGEGHFAKFREDTEREMTPAEEIASYGLKQIVVCKLRHDCESCVFGNWDVCPIGNIGFEQACKRVMEGKEVIE